MVSIWRIRCKNGGSMKKILLVPDSFKGTMSSEEICSIMKSAIVKVFPETEVISIPVADGGEGSVDAFLSGLGGKKVEVKVKGPFFLDINSFFGLLSDGTAVIEMAVACGLPMVGNIRNPERTTTFGVGQLIKHALDMGCKKIIIGLGGSATNDGGCGAAAALGVVFRDFEGQPFVPIGENLKNIHSIDLSGVDGRLSTIPVLAMCDVDNPLCGENGAAAVFGPQKGADPEMVHRLDNGLWHLSRVVEDTIGRVLSKIGGAGAAGGMGFGVQAFFNAQIKMGIDVVLDTVDFNNLAKDADLVITGEGKLDTQSLRGKVISGVLRRANKAGAPVIAVVGDIGDGVDAIYDEGIKGVFSINRVAVPYEKAKLRAEQDLYLTVENLMRYHKFLAEKRLP